MIASNFWKKKNRKAQETLEGGKSSFQNKQLCWLWRWLNLQVPQKISKSIQLYIFFSCRGVAKSYECTWTGVDFSGDPRLSQKISGLPRCLSPFCGKEWMLSLGHGSSCLGLFLLPCQPYPSTQGCMGALPAAGQIIDQSSSGVSSTSQGVSLNQIRMSTIHAGVLT